jgi:RNA polymerase sigma-70 factor, ECF subfamily
MTESNDTDIALVKKVQQGNQIAFEMLVKKYQHRVAAVVSKLIKDNDTIKDVVQESFIRAWKAINKFRMDSAFYTWLYRIAINVAKNFLQKQNRQNGKGRLDIEAAEQVNDSGKFSDISTPEGMMAKERLKRTIDDAIADLPEDMQQAFCLREYEGMSYEQIADHMNTPVGTVRSRIFRAREAVEIKIKPHLS